MTTHRLLCLVMLLMIGMVPVAGAAAVPTPTSTSWSGPVIPVSNSSDTTGMIEGSNQYGYLTIESVSYTLANTDADVVVTYQIEPWIAFLVYLFGKQDLKKRVLETLQYPESGYNQVVTFKYIDSGKAVVHITNTAIDNQDNSFWMKAHTFGCTIPTLSFALSPTDVKTFTNVKEMTKGLGFFRTSFS